MLAFVLSYFSITLYGTKSDTNSHHMQVTPCLWEQAVWVYLHTYSAGSGSFAGNSYDDGHAVSQCFQIFFGVKMSEKSGVHVLVILRSQVDGPAIFKRVSGSSIGGGTYWGLCKLLTDATNYDESLQMASRGDSDRVDMLVGDIYGRGYSKFQLSSNTLASSFGKIGGMEAPRGPNSGVGEEDLARALLVMISLNIGQVSAWVVGQVLWVRSTGQGKAGRLHSWDRATKIS